MNDITITKFKKTIDLFEKAEKALKSAETISDDIVVVPVNQIRYAFKH